MILMKARIRQIKKVVNNVSGPSAKVFTIAHNKSQLMPCFYENLKHLFVILNKSQGFILLCVLFLFKYIPIFLK